MTFESKVENLCRTLGIKINVRPDNEPVYIFGTKYVNDDGPYCFFHFYNWELILNDKTLFKAPQDLVKKLNEAVKNNNNDLVDQLDEQLCNYCYPLLEKYLKENKASIIN